MSELRRLRRGGGLLATDLLSKLGPNLRLAFEVSGAEEPSAARRRVAAGMGSLVRQLRSGRERMAVVEVYGLAPDSPAELDHRYARAAEIGARHARTVRRWVETAEERMGETLEVWLAQRAENPHAPPGWYVNRLDSVVRLDLPRPALIERREIVATHGGINHLVVTLSVPQPHGRRDASIEAEAGAGCTLVSSEQPYPSHWRFQLDLPRVLQAGQRHEYEITFTLSELAMMRAYYVLVPHRWCRGFSAVVHFGRPPVADAAWRLDGVPTSVLDDDEPRAPAWSLDGSSIVGVEFEHLEQGMAYGVGWRWSQHAPQR